MTITLLLLIYSDNIGPAIMRLYFCSLLENKTNSLFTHNGDYSLPVFALTFLDHLPKKEKKSFYYCNIPIPDENDTCRNQKQLVRGIGQVGYGEDCTKLLFHIKVVLCIKTQLQAQLQWGFRGISPN